MTSQEQDEIWYRLIVMPKTLTAKNLPKVRLSSTAYVGDQEIDDSQVILETNRLRAVKESLPQVFQKHFDPTTQVVQVVKTIEARPKIRCIKCLKRGQACPHLAHVRVSLHSVMTINGKNYLPAQQ